MPGKGDIATLLSRQHTEFVDPWANFAKYAQSEVNRMEEQKRYEAEKAQKDLLFNQAQDDRAKAEKRRAAMQQLESRSLDVLAGVSEERKKINESTEPSKDQPLVLPDLPEIPSQSTPGKLISGTSKTRVSSGTSSKKDSTSVSKATAGGYMDPNATITFTQGTDGRAVGTKDMPYVEQYKPVFGRFDTGHQAKAPISFSNLVDNAKLGLSGRTPDYKAVLANPEQFKPSVIREALLNTPGMTTERSVPASSVRETVLNDKGIQLLSQYEASVPSTKQTYTSKLSDFTFDTLYDKDGKVLKKGEIPKDGQVYAADSKGHRVDIATLGDAIQKAWKPEESITNPKVLPSKGKDGKVTTLGKSMAQISNVASKNNVSPETVKSSLRGVNADYTSFLKVLGEDNSEDRNKLTVRLTKLASDLGLTSQDYDVGKLVDRILPHNELTGRQKLFAEASIKNLEAAREDYWKLAHYNLELANFKWKQKVETQKLLLEQMGINVQRERMNAESNKQELPPGQTIINDNGVMKTVLTEAANYAAKKGVDANTPKGQAEQRRLNNEEYAEYANRNTFLGFGPKHKSPDAWIEAGRPWKD